MAGQVRIAGGSCKVEYMMRGKRRTDNKLIVLLDDQEATKLEVRCKGIEEPIKIDLTQGSKGEELVLLDWK